MPSPAESCRELPRASDGAPSAFLAVGGLVAIDGTTLDVADTLLNDAFCGTLSQMGGGDAACSTSHETGSCLPTSPR